MLVFNFRLTVYKAWKIIIVREQNINRMNLDNLKIMLFLKWRRGRLMKGSLRVPKSSSFQVGVSKYCLSLLNQVIQVQFIRFKFKHQYKQTLGSREIVSMY